MRGSKLNRGWGAGIAVITAALVVPALAPAAENQVGAERTKVFRASADAQVAKKKKKKAKKPIVTTASTQFAVASGSIPSGAAACPAKTHATGGGFNLTPGFSGPSAGGRVSFPVSLVPTGVTGWSASQAIASVVPGSGTFTVYSRCEGTSLGTITDQVSGSATLPGGQLSNLNFQCRPNEHTIAGGYVGAPPANLANATSQDLLILGSRRTGPETWTVTGVNRGANPVTLTGYGVCEADRKGTSISEAVVQVATPNDQRATGEASCTGKTHSVSGGFNIIPNGNNIPVFQIDDYAPVGEKGWRAGGWDFPALAGQVPAGLQASVYCKPNATKKKKKKKK
jgi:hypothetical protein